MDKNKETKKKTAQTELEKKREESIDKALGTIAYNLSEYVKKLKVRAGNISSREMCRRCDISIAVLSDIIGHKYVPKMEVILKIAYGMNVSILKMLDNLWDNDDAIEWSESTDTPVSNHMVERKNSNAVNNTSLDEMLAKEGLTKNDVKEVLEFIAFKKSRQKRR